MYSATDSTSQSLVALALQNYPGERSIAIVVHAFRSEDHTSNMGGQPEQHSKNLSKTNKQKSKT